MMIVDRLDNCRRYAGLHSRFDEAFDWLGRGDLAQLAEGRHEIAGEHLHVIIARDRGRGREKAMLEFHRRFVDIQFVINGEDLIGWMPTVDCRRVSTPYDAEKDIGFCFDRPGTWLAIPAGTFAIFFPDDAHAPLAAEGNVHKAIVKVAVEGS